MSLSQGHGIDSDSDSFDSDKKTGVKVVLRRNLDQDLIQKLKLKYQALIFN